MGLKNTSILLMSLLLIKACTSEFDCDESANSKNPKLCQLNEEQTTVIMIDDSTKARILTKQTNLKFASVDDINQALTTFKHSRTQINNQAHASTSWSYMNVTEGIELGHTLLKNRTGRLFIQAPHQFSDRYSGKIALGALEYSRTADVVFLNSQHRTSLDYSRETHSVLTELSHDYLAVSSAATIVQLHGFAKSKRQTNSAQQANFIISSGNIQRRKLPLFLKTCLSDAGFNNTLVYGQDSTELGATKNPVKKRMYQIQRTRFLHIEMSLQQRQNLIQQSDQLAKFYACLDLTVEYEV